MKKFLWIAFLSFCFSGVAAESDWNADSVQVYFSRSVTPVIQKNWKDHKLILKTYRQFLKICESVRFCLETVFVVFYRHILQCGLLRILDETEKSGGRCF